MKDRDKTTVPIRALETNMTRPILPVDPLIGHRIAGRYELLQPLAKGGFGKVYKARDTKLERIVAIKLVDVGEANEDMRSRMLREARANARLHHANVVVLHDAGEDLYGLYLVLEYIAGTSLAEALSAGPLPAHRAAEIARECAVALAAAHAHGIVHRDIKPANILLTESGRVKVADFGVARMVGEARLTDRGSIIGTPNYMAPEQVDGAEVGPEADMFALGCVLYEMLAGRPPFDGKTTSEVLGRILRGSPDPMPPLNHSVAPLVDAVAALLDKNPKRRLLPNELIERLRSWERRDDVRSIKGGRRSRVALITAAAVVAAVIGATLALRDRDLAVTPPAPPSILVRVTDAPVPSGAESRETLRFSSRDALFAYLEYAGRERGDFTKVDDRTISVEGPTETVRRRAQEAKVIDQFHGYDFFREPSRLTTGQTSSRKVTCDFAAIQPSELIALFSAAAGWPVVQSADEPIESSAYLRVDAVSQPWDDVVLGVLRAAGLATFRYETIWLVTSEDARIVPPLKVAVIFPRRYSTQDVRQLAERAVSEHGVVWPVESEGSDGVIVVDHAGGINTVLAAISDVQGSDWKVVSPQRFTGPPISLRLENAPLRDVLDFYSNLTQRPHLPDKETAAWVRASVVEIPADEYLAAVLDANGLVATGDGRRVVTRPFATESIDVVLQNTSAATFEPLEKIASRAARTTGMITTIDAQGTTVRIAGRNDVARDLAEVVRTIDRVLGR